MLRHPSSILMQHVPCITRPDEWSIAMTAHSIAAHWFRAVSPVRILRRIRRHPDVVRSRRALLRLDDHLLQDIGLSRHEAEAEAARAPWDAPLHWRG
jgi:uncharacterized protein YjiS (DUF1127 family)